MKLRQAVFVSATVDQTDKIGLAGRSEGIDDSLTNQLVCWIPQRWELAQCHVEGFSFFQLNDELFALSRSVRGVDRLRGRDEKQLVTSVLLIRRKQLEAFGNNAAILATVVLTHGGMLLPIQFQQNLPLLEVPDRTCLTPNMVESNHRTKETEAISRAVDIHQHVAIVGLPDPLDYLGGHLSMLKTETRLNISFAIGLDVSPIRPFQLQFFRGSDISVQQELSRQQIRTISLAPKLVSASCTLA